MYFNIIAPSVNAPGYIIDRRAYHDLLPSHEDSHQAGLAVVRFSNLVVRPGLPPLFSERDCFWIECNAHDRNAGRVERLAFFRGTRMVYLILAIGLKWIFRWDPTSTLGSQLLEFPAHGEGDCPLVR